MQRSLLIQQPAGVEAVNRGEIRARQRDNVKVTRQTNDRSLDTCIGRGQIDGLLQRLL